MRVAMLTGMLVVGLFTTFYRFGWSNYAAPSRDASSVTTGRVVSGQVHAMDDFPPPPSYP
jgi:hypothetical protein